MDNIIIFLFIQETLLSLPKLYGCFSQNINTKFKKKIKLTLPHNDRLYLTACKFFIYLALLLHCKQTAVPLPGYKPL